MTQPPLQPLTLISVRVFRVCESFSVYVCDTYVWYDFKATFWSPFSLSPFMYTGSRDQIQPPGLCGKDPYALPHPHSSGFCFLFGGRGCDCLFSVLAESLGLPWTSPISPHWPQTCQESSSLCLLCTGEYSPELLLCLAFMTCFYDAAALTPASGIQISARAMSYIPSLSLLLELSPAVFRPFWWWVHARTLEILLSDRH